MALLRSLTKHIFCFRDGGEKIGGRDGEAQIKDGRVIDEALTPQPPPDSSQAQTSPEIIQPPLTSPPTQDTLEDNEASEEKHKQGQGRLPAPARFWTHLEVAGRGRGTVREYHYDLRWWEKNSQRIGRSVYTLRVRDIEASLRGMHPATVRRKLAFLRVLGRWYLREGYPRLHAETGKVISPRMPEKIPRDRGSQAFVELREKAKAWCRRGKREGAWLGLMLMAGLRISEIQTVVAAGNGRIQVRGKGQKERIVPAAGWLLQTLERVPREGRGGWAQGRMVIWKGLQRQGIRKPHSLRHTYASELLRRGRSIEDIRALLGHASISTTNIYARLSTPPAVAELLDHEP